MVPGPKNMLTHNKKVRAIELYITRDCHMANLYVVWPVFLISIYLVAEDIAAYAEIKPMPLPFPSLKLKEALVKNPIKS